MFWGVRLVFLHNMRVCTQEIQFHVMIPSITETVLEGIK